MKAQRPTASSVMAALTKRYSPPAWALLEQCSNGTGYNGSRYADALALSLWPSRGIHLHGFEVKTYRNDWLRELKSPEKADEMVGFCDYWWIVAGDGAVVKLDELPAPWGLMVLDGRGLVTHKQAEKRNPTPLDTPMLAAMLRRATEAMVPRSGVQASIDEARERGEAIGRATAPGGDRVRDSLNDLEKRVREFEATSGVSIGNWSSGNHGRAFKMVLELGDDGVVGRAKYISENLRRSADALDKLLATPAPEGS